MNKMQINTYSPANERFKSLKTHKRSGWKLLHVENIRFAVGAVELQYWNFLMISHTPVSPTRMHPNITIIYNFIPETGHGS